MRYQGTTLSTGTGFVVDTNVGPVLLTNRHNVTGQNNDTDELLSTTGGTPNEILIRHNKAGAIGQTISIVEPLYRNEEEPLWLEHPLLGKRADFVALPLTEWEGATLEPILVGPPKYALQALPATVVSVIGFPFGLTAGQSFAVWATGFIASEPDVDFDNLPIFLIDCRTRQGQSGSPVFLFQAGGRMTPLESGASAVFDGPVARFMGIYSGRINKDSDIGKVWKAEAVNTLISSLQRNGDRVISKPPYLFKHKPD